VGFEYETGHMGFKKIWGAQSLPETIMEEIELELVLEPALYSRAPARIYTIFFFFSGPKSWLVPMSCDLDEYG